MVNFQTNGKNGSVILNLPTNIKEITPDYLLKITEDIKIADNYSLIALCHREKLSAFILAGKNKKNEMSTAVVPIFVKQGNTNAVFAGSINTCDKLLVAPSQLAMGLHVNVPKNTLTMGTLLNFIDGDGYAYKNALNYKEEVYFIEFKVIPNCDIIGIYKDYNNSDFDNPFAITKIKEDK